jgi:hypothetical protein
VDDIVKNVLAEHERAMEEHRIWMAKARLHRLLAAAALLFIAAVSLIEIPGAVPAPSGRMPELSSHGEYVVAATAVLVAGLFAIIAWLFALLNKQARVSGELIELAFALGRSVGPDNTRR